MLFHFPAKWPNAFLLSKLSDKFFFSHSTQRTNYNGRFLNALIKEIVGRHISSDFVDFLGNETTLKIFTPIQQP